MNELMKEVKKHQRDFCKLMIYPIGAMILLLFLGFIGGFMSELYAVKVGGIMGSIYCLCVGFYFGLKYMEQKIKEINKNGL